MIQNRFLLPFFSPPSLAYQAPSVKKKSSRLTTALSGASFSAARGFSRSLRLPGEQPARVREWRVLANGEAEEEGADDAAIERVSPIKVQKMRKFGKWNTSLFSFSSPSRSFSLFSTPPPPLSLLAGMLQKDESMTKTHTSASHGFEEVLGRMFFFFLFSSSPITRTTIALQLTVINAGLLIDAVIEPVYY